MCGLCTDVDVNTAAPCCIALGPSLAESADQLLQKIHILVGEDRCDHFALLGVRTRDAYILLEFPFPVLGIPGAPSLVTVAVSGVTKAVGAEELGGDLCCLAAGDVVHLDLNTDRLLLHFCDLICYLCVHN